MAYGPAHSRPKVPWWAWLIVALLFAADVIYLVMDALSGTHVG